MDKQGWQVVSTPLWMAASNPGERNSQFFVDLAQSIESRDASQTANRPAIDDTHEAPRQMPWMRLKQLRRGALPSMASTRNWSLLISVVMRGMV